ncbi:right-handed parallel beta-helix repeat-containing protein [Gilvimarinus sp. DA14]|uniref:right-handed parallel beta-helix repeat-containing protein n=1 Tax=Gilvimarinus sp. DA14 TaxID=2956798 RepID=UPI0020B7AE55|nr:right-handed parallel beta-helix repeat-containing protein [Gilvimarinus sp. DA14]UTF59861.1 right-handed parallel beta-helix repeat-containing protein [Gilvimarinus sp. DA14]
MAKAFTCLLLLLLPVLVSAQSAQADLTQEVEALTADAACCRRPEAIDASQYRLQPQWRLETMFSAQEGSWPFEPFTNNGLFTVIARYQSAHPKIVTLVQGRFTLDELYKKIARDDIISRFNDGYLLHYPIMVLPDAHLLIDNTELHLSIYGGAAVINRGAISIQGSLLTVRQGDSPKPSMANFRPFVMNWAGSLLDIESSKISKLGYHANLSTGIASARSKHQPANSAPPQVTVVNSEFNDVNIGLDLHTSDAFIDKTRFLTSRHHAINIDNSQVSVVASHFAETTVNSLIRITGDSRVLIEGSKLMDSAKHGVEWSASSGAVSLRGTLITGSGQHGVAVKPAPQQGAAVLLSDGNVISQNLGAGINIERPVATLVENTLFSANTDYAISYRTDGGHDSNTLLLRKSRFVNSLAPAVRAQKLDRLVLQDNQFDLSQVNQELFSGDLAPYQSSLAAAVFRDQCPTQVVRDVSANRLVVSTLAGDSPECKL